MSKLPKNMEEKLTEQLIRHEGLRVLPYKDSEGKLTIGVGRNLDDKGIRRAEAMFMLSNDIAEAYFDAERFVGVKVFHELNEVRQIVLVDMAFNMGLTKLNGFKRFKSALMRHNYDEAESEMEDSKWCVQVGTRCRNLRRMMRTGDWSR